MRCVSVVLAFLAPLGIARADVTFHFDAAPNVAVTTYDPYAAGGPQTLGTQAFTPTQVAEILDRDTFFLANPVGNAFSDSRAEGVYDLAEMTFSAGGVTLRAGGSACVSWGFYTTSGVGISRNSLTDASVDLTTYGHSLPGATCVWTPGAEPDTTRNTFLPVYVNTWESGDARVDAAGAPALRFGRGVTLRSMDVANTAYVAGVLRDANGYGRAFSYADGDFFGLTITALDADGLEIEGRSKTVLLADFRTYADADAPLAMDPGTLTYYPATDGITGAPSGTPTTVTYTSLANGVLDDWATFQLEELGELHGLRFTLFSSDIGEWGFNTPFYFALDDVVVAGADSGADSGVSVPEPGAGALLAVGFGALLAWRRVRSGKGRDRA